MIPRRKLITGAVASFATVALSGFTHDRARADSILNGLDKLYLTGATRAYEMVDQELHERLAAEEGTVFFGGQSWAFVFASEQAASKAYPLVEQLFLGKAADMILLFDLEDHAVPDPGLGEPWAAWYLSDPAEGPQSGMSFGHMHWQHGNIIHVMQGMAIPGGETVVQQTAELAKIVNTLQFQDRPVVANADGTYSGGAFDVMLQPEHLPEGIVIDPEYEHELSAFVLREMLSERGIT